MAKEKKAKLYIYTLGNFDIKLGEKSLLDTANKSFKILTLLKYFLSFNEKRLLPESIIDHIYPENESSDPKNVLRTQIFRLRRFLKEILGETGNYLDISFVAGYYVFSLSEGVFFDVAEFEKKAKAAKKIKETDKNQAKNLYKEALALYKGNYLLEDTHEWLVPIRNYYNRLYIQSIFNLIEIYREDGDYNQILEVCEEALRIEPAEEGLHIVFIEALLNLGRVRAALSHYEFISTWFLKELGVKPSSSMKSIYRKIRSYDHENNIFDLEKINMEFVEDMDNKPLLCDLDYFKFLYNWSRRRSSRQEKLDYFGLATLTKRTNLSLEENKEIIRILTNLVNNSLRKGDIYSFWNETQLIMIVYEIDDKSLETIEDRINKNFQNLLENKKSTLEIKFKPIISNERLII